MPIDTAARLCVQTLVLTGPVKANKQRRQRTFVSDELVYLGLSSSLAGASPAD